jgi:hypothetical protein
MRKIALFVALAMIAASPAMAAQKKSMKSADPQANMTDAQKQNDNSYRLMRDSLPMWLPSWAQPIYQYGVKPKVEADAKPVTTKKKSKTAAKVN